MPAPPNSNANPGSTGVGEPANAQDVAILAEAHAATGKDVKTDPPAGLAASDPVEPTRLPADPANPPPVQAEAPKEPKLKPDDRKPIYDKFRSKPRASEPTDHLFSPDLPEDFRLASQGDTLVPVEPVAVAPAPVEPVAPVAADPLDEPLTLKINHQLFAVTRRQAAELAGLSEDAAKILKVDDLVRMAQIAEANRLRATKAPDAAPAAASPAPAPPTPAASSVPAPPQAPAYDFDKIMFGDPEEQRQEFQKAIREEAAKIVKEQRQVETQEDRLGRATLEIASTMQDLAQRAPELVNDEVGSAVMADQSVKLMIDNLVAIGAPREELEAMRGSPGQILDVYRQTYAAGQRVEAPKDLLAKAEAKTRAMLNRPAPVAAPQPVPIPQPAPQPTALQARVAGKQALPQVQPRSGSETGQARGPDPQLSTRSAAIAKMQAVRGQRTIGT